MTRTPDDLAALSHEHHSRAAHALGIQGYAQMSLSELTAEVQVARPALTKAIQDLLDRDKEHARLESQQPQEHELHLKDEWHRMVTTAKDNLTTARHAFESILKDTEYRE